MPVMMKSGLAASTFVPAIVASAFSCDVERFDPRLSVKVQVP